MYQSKISSHSLRPSLVALIVLTLILMGTAVVAITRAAAQPTQNDSFIYMPSVMGRFEFAVEPIPGSFDRVTDIANAGDDRLFIVERGGRVRVMEPTGAISTFLDISSRVDANGGEKGMFSIAFHPNYASNGTFFVSYTGPEGSSTNVFVSRFQVSGNPNVADAGSEERIFRAGQLFDVHNGGGLRFNPVDGYLYFGLGDDLQFTIAQDNTFDKGKLLYLDVDAEATAVPQTVAGLPNAAAYVPVEIAASGLRNAWKFGIHPLYGHIYIGDVGSNLYEEINVIPFGLENLNFGWPCMEGPEITQEGGPCANPERFSRPAYYYKHGVEPGQGCAIIAGEVILGDGPASEDRLIFGDSCSGEIYTIRNIQGTWDIEQLGIFENMPNILTTFGIDNAGTIYAGTHASGGPIFKLFIP